MQSLATDSAEMSPERCHQILTWQLSSDVAEGLALRFRRLRCSFAPQPDVALLPVTQRCHPLLWRVVLGWSQNFTLQQQQKCLVWIRSHSLSCVWGVLHEALRSCLQLLGFFCFFSCLVSLLQIQNFKGQTVALGRHFSLSPFLTFSHTANFTQNWFHF